MSTRTRMILIAAILAIVAFAGAYLVATASDDDVAAVQTPGPTTTAPSTPPPGSPSTSTATTPAPTPTADPDLLDDGLHFVKVKGYEADRDGSPALQFDLAYLYTGAGAYDYAQAHNIEMTNDYVIANDNPRLRWMPLADGVAIKYIPEGTCCTLHAGTLDGFDAAVNAIAMTDYPSMDTTWWFLTVADGRITKIVQQYFP